MNFYNTNWDRGLKKGFDWKFEFAHAITVVNMPKVGSFASMLGCSSKWGFLVMLNLIKIITIIYPYLYRNSYFYPTWELWKSLPVNKQGDLLLHEFIFGLKFPQHYEYDWIWTMEAKKINPMMLGKQQLNKIWSTTINWSLIWLLWGRTTLQGFLWRSMEDVRPLGHPVSVVLGL